MSTNKVSSLRKFLPLIIVGLLVLVLTGITQLLRGIPNGRLMQDFMGIFFLVFGLFKIINLRAFAQAYGKYDIITQRFNWWAYLYPFIELFLGLAYLSNYRIQLVLVITLILMTVGSTGIYKQLKKRQSIQCACLGALFNIPMTYVTLAEDLLMAIMAGLMLIK